MLITIALLEGIPPLIIILGHSYMAISRFVKESYFHRSRQDPRFYDDYWP